MILPSITVEPNQISFIFYFYFSFCNWGILKVWSRNLALSNPWPSPSDFHFLPSVQTWDWSFQCCPSVYLLKLLWLFYKSITLIFELFECAPTGHSPQCNCSFWRYICMGFWLLQTVPLRQSFQWTVRQQSAGICPDPFKYLWDVWPNTTSVLGGKALVVHINSTVPP